MKKIMTLILTLVMVLAMGTSAFAATVDITITDTGATSSYSAYRLLNLTTSVDSNDSGTVHYAYTLNKDKASYTTILQHVTGKTTEAEILKYISDLDGNPDAVRGFAEDVYAAITTASPAISADETITNNNVFEGVPQGYYLIVETATKPNTQDIISLVMLDTAGESNVNVTTKESYPTLEKKVDDKNDSTTDENDIHWQDSADYDIGDTIPYKLTGTLSSQYANYKTYYYSFTDTMEHLTYKDGSVKVYLSHDNVLDMQSDREITNEFTPNWEGKTLTVTCNDLKKITNPTISATDYIIVYYEATLDDDAKIGYEGNPNTAKLIYNNNPYYDGTGETEPEDETNETPEDTNIVFTFKTIVNKYDNNNNNRLPGAVFTLYKFDKAINDYAAVTKVLTTGKENTEFSFAGLDAGRYKLEETTPPAGYNKADDIYFEIAATHEETADAPKLTGLTVNILKADGNPDTSGKISFAVVKDGENFTGNISTDVINTTGTELPSTGGIGTTIFYVIGGLLVFAAAILLVVKKRMGNRA